ncbi:unnamed protein product [Caenorhabditis brenneri]
MMELPGKCASPELLSSLSSSLIMTNHCFILIVIVISFFATFFALQKLKKQNIFPNCTRTLLWSAIFNGVVHQLTVAEIRIKTIFRTISYVSEPCSIQFQSTECIVENSVYYYTNLFTSLCCISLFFDRLFSIHSKYSKNYKWIIITFLVFQTVAPIFILYWVYYGAQYTGYVAMCNYPPGLTARRFYIMNNFRLYILGTFFFLSLALFCYNKIQEKRTVHKVYDTKSRYNTYENLLASQVVCIIVSVQAACLVITATGTEKIHTWSDIIPYSLVAPLTGFMTGLTYSNFFLPIIICYQTNRIIKRRYCKIKKVRKEKSKFLEHFAALDRLWQISKNID